MIGGENGCDSDHSTSFGDGVNADFFFVIVNEYLASKISIIIEAAFQHDVWESRMPEILELASPMIVLCSVADAVAAMRHPARLRKSKSRDFSWR